MKCCWVLQGRAPENKDKARTHQPDVLFEMLYLCVPLGERGGGDVNEFLVDLGCEL